MADSHTVIPLSPLRKAIAARMTEATATIPHFRLSRDIEVDALLALRMQFRSQSTDAGPSLTDLLIKASAAALMDTPAVNIQWVQGNIYQFSSVDISVVIAVDGGLATPIIRNADVKSVFEIAREVRSLAARAAKKTLRMDEIIGGSFSISNLGMHDVDEFDAIINPPQCAILAVGTAKQRYVLSPDNRPRVATVMRVTLSVDHRALDGVVAAKFLASLRRRVEQPEHLLPNTNGGT